MLFTPFLEVLNEMKLQGNGFLLKGGCSEESDGLLPFASSHALPLSSPLPPLLRGVCVSVGLKWLVCGTNEQPSLSSAC